jgi:LacI family transcriptional regulator
MTNVSKRTTITDVACAANVSIQTVSAVFHDKPGISNQTRDRVRRIIQRLCYEPNGLASSLHAQRSLTVGVLIPSITNPFFADFVRGIEDVAHLNRYSVFLCNSDQDPEKETQYLQLLRWHNVAGYLLAYDLNNLAVERILIGVALQGTPVVAFGSRQLHKKVNIIRAEDEEGSFRITSHLIELGHRRIAMIQGPVAGSGSPVNRNRTRGYIRALRSARVRVLNSYIVPGGFSVSDGQRGAEILMAQSPVPTAIVAANDLVAIGALTALKRMGRRVPEEVSIVGYDNIQISELVDPPLTTISQPTSEIGKRAMEAVLEQIQHPGAPGKVIRFDTPLVVRQSTDKPNSAQTKQIQTKANERNGPLQLGLEPTRFPLPKWQSRSRH